MRRKVNFAWWLEALAAPMLLASIVGAAALLWVRREMPGTDPQVLAVISGGIILVIGVIAWLRVWKRFETSAQSLVRIEAAMRMRNALSAAQAGVSPWPEPAPKGALDAGLGWNWRRMCVPVLGPLAMVAAGLLIPISAETTVERTAEKPQAWGRLAEELDYLAAQELVDETYIEETRKQLEELTSQPEESWFSHASLEATDNLRESHRAEAGKMAGEMEKTAETLEAAEQNPGADAARQQQLAEEFDRALEGLRNGAMKPNPELLQQLKDLDLRNLTPEQLQKLRERLEENARELRECAECEGGGEGEEDEAGEGDKAVPGRGAPTRGPGHVEGLLGDAGEQPETGAAAPLESQDLSKSATGDLLELQDGEHEVDRSKAGLSAGGAAGATGSGGDRVWRDSLDPAEQRAIKRFFE